MVDHVGQQFGNYRLTRLLGKGGFAEVYLGEHIYLKSLAAIKVLLTSLDNAGTANFLAEAQTLAGLKHPHVVRILDYGMQGDIPFLVMDYAPNGTLRDRHPRNSVVPPGAVVAYVKQLASALQYAHDQKLIHRDIKPENMLLQDSNELLLSDFGVAVIAQSSQLSKQEVIGTAAYMSPEQIRGTARQSSDQYALGVVAYEWLSGSSLFQGSFTEVCAQHMFAAPQSLRLKVPAISAPIEQVVMMALAKDPAQRFASVKAFANALEQAYNCEPAPSSQIAVPASSYEDDLRTVPSPPDINIPGPFSFYPSQQPVVSALQASTTQTEDYQTLPFRTSSAGQGINLPTTPVARQPSNGLRRLHWKGYFTPLVLVVLACLVVASGIFSYLYAMSLHPARPEKPSKETLQATSSPQQGSMPKSTSTTASVTPTVVPTPGITPTTTPTLRPTAGSGTTGPLVYSSSFHAQDKLQWDVINFADNGFCRFDSGGYRIYMPASQNYIVGCVARQSDFTGDFTMSVSMTLKQGFMIGLIFRADQKDEYRWRISPDGTWDLVGSNIYYAQGSSTAIKGLGQVNILKVVARGTRYYLYINGQSLGSYIADTVTGRMVGLFTVSSPTQTADARFSSISIWVP